MKMKSKSYWRKSLDSLQTFFDNQPFDYNIKDKDSILIEALRDNLLYQYQNFNIQKNYLVILKRQNICLR